MNGGRKGARRWILASVLAMGGGWPLQAAPAPTIEFVGGRWWTESGFVARERFYSVRGRFTDEAPRSVERSIDLTGLYVVPPFGDAHHHNPDPYRIGAKIREHLEVGVFYVKNPASLPRETARIARRVNKPTSLDVTVAGGVLTAPGGHPIQIAQRNIEQGSWTEEDGEGGFYWAVGDRTDLDAKWPAILAQPRDFLKTFLLYSEDYLGRRDDEAYFGAKGLDPLLLPEIVARAHAAGLRVSTHIETVADFRAAVEAGVDEINHMVGFRPDPELILAEGFGRYRMKASDATRAAAAGVVVVTTLGGLIEDLVALRGDPDPAIVALARKMEKITRRNLRLLSRKGVRIAIGGDRYELTARDEIRALVELGAFRAEDLLEAWSVTTPLAIFPERAIARLEPGFEASLLALAGNPLQDFAATEAIVLRIKQGRVLR